MTVFMYVDESLSLDMTECTYMSTQIRPSAFFGQQHKEETAEMSTEHDEAEPENKSERNRSC